VGSAATGLQQQQQQQEEEVEEQQQQQWQWQPGIQPQAVQPGTPLAPCTTTQPETAAAAVAGYTSYLPAAAAAVLQEAGAPHLRAPIPGSREWQKQLVASLKATAGWDALQDLLTQHGADMDCISVTTVVTQSAALHRRASETSPSAAGAVRETVLQHVVPFLLTKVALLDPSGLVNILHKLSAMEVKHEELYTRLVRLGGL
jgi:hypothetical protein